MMPPCRAVALGRAAQPGLRDMNTTAYLPAVAALAGSAIGGLTSVASAWLTQHHQDRAKLLLQDKGRRQLLYKQFIEESSKLYADALAHNEAEISAMVSVYALLSRMRVLSSSAVVKKAETVLQMVVDTYFQPNTTFPEFRELLKTHQMDPLRAFSEECRAELQALRDP
jgi:hypothetical protein